MRQPPSSNDMFNALANNIYVLVIGGNGLLYVTPSEACLDGEGQARMVRAAARGTGYLLLLAFLSLAAGCTGRGQEVRDKDDDGIGFRAIDTTLVGPVAPLSMAEIRVPLRCEGLQIPVHVLSASVRESACTLVERSLDVLKRGGAGGAGAQASDTSALTLAVVSRVLVVSVKGDTVGWLDVTSFGMRHGEYAVRVQFGSDGAVQWIGKEEPLLLP